MGIVFDGGLISSPALNDEIKRGRAVITGSFSVTEARAVVTMLNSGSLPLPLRMIDIEEYSEREEE